VVCMVGGGGVREESQAVKIHGGQVVVLRAGSHYWVLPKAPGPSHPLGWTIGQCEAYEDSGEIYGFDIIASDCPVELGDILQVGPRIEPPTAEVVDG
jgi:hypothetical protein